MRRYCVLGSAPGTPNRTPATATIPSNGHDATVTPLNPVTPTKKKSEPGQLVVYHRSSPSVSIRIIYSVYDYILYIPTPFGFLCLRLSHDISNQ